MKERGGERGDVKNFRAKGGEEAYQIPLTTLLIEQLARLAHGHADELVLASTSSSSTARKHLESLHRGSIADGLAAVPAPTAGLVPVHALVRADHALLVHVALREAGLVALGRHARRYQRAIAESH